MGFIKEVLFTVQCDNCHEDYRIVAMRGFSDEYKTIFPICKITANTHK